MKSRILQVRKYLKLSQKEFGDALGVSRDVIANYENGRVIPPNSILKLLCSAYSINPVWLETGQGEMVQPVNKEDELEAFLKKLSQDDPKGFKRRLVTVMGRLTEEDWRGLEHLAHELAEEFREPTTPSDPMVEVADLKQRVEALEKEEAGTEIPTPIRTSSH